MITNKVIHERHPDRNSRTQIESFLQGAEFANGLREVDRMKIRRLRETMERIIRRCAGGATTTTIMLMADEALQSDKRGELNR